MDSILIVLVLYKTKITDSLSYISLKKHIHNLKCKYQLIIYNNSPEITVDKSVDYIVNNSNNNNMLSGAYNFAYEYAIENNFSWLLLLDQDTQFSDLYIERINQFLLYKINVAAVVPLCKKGSVFISPKHYSPTLGPSGWNKIINHSCITNKCVFAINSGTMINIKTLNEIGGFSLDYPLDMLDYWYFYQFYKRKKNIMILDVTIEQDLSLLDFKKNINKERYLSILESEFKFNNELGKMSIITWKSKLFLRIIKYFFKGIDFSILKMIFYFLFK